MHTRSMHLKAISTISYLTPSLDLQDVVDSKALKVKGIRIPMNRIDFMHFLDSIQEEERKVREEGQKEYAHTDSNCFANFERIGLQLGLPREQVLLVYALKHWDGIIAYINGHKSQREDIRGRIKDLRLYLALLWGMVEEDEIKQKGKDTE